MRGLFRGNSFSSRLLQGSSSGLSTAIIAFLLVLLALTLQQTFRLNNEIERLHWQLALTQFVRAENSRESPPPTHPLHQDSTETAKLLQQVGRHHVTKPQHEDDSCTEQQELSTSWRWIVGVVLLCVLIGSGYTWLHLDALSERARIWLGHSEGTTRMHPFSAVIAYEMDLWFSSHKYAKVTALFFFTLLLVLVGSLAMFSVSNVSLYEAVWGCFAGVGIDWTFSEDWNDSHGLSSFLGRFVSMLISLGGLLITALLLGIVSEIISTKVDEMKKGKSQVLETSHTLILGWSDEVVPIVKQLCLANESIGGSAVNPNRSLSTKTPFQIVVLSEKDKEEMEEEISINNIDFLDSRVICRSGNPLLKHDLETVSVGSARSIIVLADEQSPDQSDARVLRIVLSLAALYEAGTLEGYIVAELCDMDNEPLVRLVGGQFVQTVVSHDIIGRLMIQCAQQPGLAAVWEELLGFSGCEFYLQNWPQLTNKKFSEALMTFPEAIPIGIKRKMNDKIILNPPDNYTLEDGDQLIVIAEDEDTYQPQTPPNLDPGECPEWGRERLQEKILFCGWRRDMDDLIVVLDEFVPPGSELWLYNDIPLQEREELLVQGGLHPERNLKNLKLMYKEEGLKGDLITRKKLAALEPLSFSSILILADESAKGADLADADSRNLATLLLLRDLMAESLGSQTSTDSKQTLRHLRTASMSCEAPVVVSEILDARTRHLITQLNISEFVMSNELVSMTLAMVAEDANVNSILRQLFSEKDAELYVHPAEKYFHEDEEKLSFFELMLRCRQYKEIAIGYRMIDQGELVINPQNKHEKKLNRHSVESIVVVADDP
eukprot:g2963.t1